MSCPETEVLVDYVDGRLRSRAFRDVEKHVAGCEICRGIVDDLVARESLLSEASAPPLDAAAVAREVARRLREGEGAGEVPED